MKEHNLFILVRILANLIIHNKGPTVIFHSIVDLYYILKWSNSVVSHTEIFHCHVYSSLSEYSPLLLHTTKVSYERT
jgi:hypothetical protein